MKQVISGKLGRTPELKEVTLADGKTAKVVNFTVYAYDPTAPEVEREDGSSYRKGIPLSCTAWDKNAEAIADMKTGSVITASSTLRHNEFTREDGTVVERPNYTIKRIDRENEIQKQISALLTGYEEGNYDQLFSPDAEQPEFLGPGKQQDKTIGKDPVEPEKEAEADKE